MDYSPRPTRKRSQRANILHLKATDKIPDNTYYPQAGSCAGSSRTNNIQMTMIQDPDRHNSYRVDPSPSHSAHSYESDVGCEDEMWDFYVPNYVKESNKYRSKHGRHQRKIVEHHGSYASHGPGEAIDYSVLRKCRASNI